MIKIIQITDLHIESIDGLANGIDTCRNFDMVLEEVILERPDFIVLTGDLCFKEPKAETYKWVKQKMDAIEIPYFVISGNHDHSETLASVFHFPFSGTEVYYDEDWGEMKMLFLDTAVSKMSEKQWSWFEKQLDTSTENLLIFMHHPPVQAGVPHMDMHYSFLEMERFSRVCKNYGKPLSIFCGHYHVDRYINKENLNVFITPSCFIQISDQYEHFQADHYIPAYRRIETDGNGLRTTLRYLFPKS